MAETGLVKAAVVPSGCGSQALSITYRSVELPGKATWKEGKEKIKARCHWLELEEQRRPAGAGIWGWGLAETRGEEDVQCLEILALHCLALPFQAFLQASRSKSPINAVSWVFFFLCMILARTSAGHRGYPVAAVAAECLVTGALVTWSCTSLWGQTLSDLLGLGCGTPAFPSAQGSVGLVGHIPAREGLLSPVIPWVRPSPGASWGSGLVERLHPCSGGQGMG